MLGADLRNIDWTDVGPARRATTLGAYIDATAVAALPTAGATGPGHQPELQLAARPGTELAFDPTGEILAVAAALGVQLRRITDGTHLRTLTGHTGLVESVTWSPDGRHLATASHDGTVRVWNTADGTYLRTLTGHTDKVESVGWSPDGRHLATASHDGTLRLWHATDGTAVAIICAWTDGWAVLYPDGRYKFDGNPQGEFWWGVGLARFEPGELDNHVPAITRVDASTPLL